MILFLEIVDIDLSRILNYGILPIIMNDLYAQYKSKNASAVIQFQGQLDRMRVQALWQKIIQMASIGHKKVAIDMFGAGPVLAEGVYEMQDCWNEYSGSLDSSIVFRNFNERAAQTFQMYGVNFSNRQAKFQTQEKIGQTNSKPIGLLRCPGCNANLRIWQNGSNACPVCGMKFKAAF